MLIHFGSKYISFNENILSHSMILIHREKSHHGDLICRRRCWVSPVTLWGSLEGQTRLPAVLRSQLGTDVMEPRPCTQKGTGTPASNADRLVLFCWGLYWGDLVSTLKSGAVKITKGNPSRQQQVATHRACIKQSSNHFSSFPTVTRNHPPYLKNSF